MILSLSSKMWIFAVRVSFQDVDSEGPEPSDWDKYASEEYEILVAEETANEQLHEGYDAYSYTSIHAEEPFPVFQTLLTSCTFT